MGKKASVFVTVSLSVSCSSCGFFWEKVVVLCSLHMQQLQKDVRTTLIMDWEGYVSQADVVSQVVFITFLLCSSLCHLFVGTLLVKGCCRKCCCCLVRDATEEVPRNTGLGIFTAKYIYIYICRRRYPSPIWKYGDWIIAYTACSGQ